MWVPDDGGAAEWFDDKALLEGSERFGAVNGSEVVEVRARGYKLIVVVCNGHCWIFNNERG